MKYMLLIATDPSEYATMTEDDNLALMAEYRAFTQRIVESGEMVGGDPLHGVSTATTIKVRGGKTSVTDGPFAETKEHIGGYYIIDVATLDRALELAAQVPGARLGSIEVRPIQDMSM